MSNPSFIVPANQSLSSGSYILDGSVFRQWGTSDLGINLSNFATCDIILDVHEATHTSAGRIAGGILGGVIAGPLGAVAGLMTGGKKMINETEVYCSLIDGRRFKAVCSREHAAALKAAFVASQRANSTTSVQQAYNVIKGEKKAERTKECPQCAETVKLRAKICRFCNHVFELDEKQLILESLTKDPKYIKFVSAFDEYRNLASVEVHDEDFEKIYRICQAVTEKYGPIHEDYEIENIACLAAQYFSFGCKAYISKYPGDHSPDESPNGMLIHNLDILAQCFTDGTDGPIEEQEMEEFLYSTFDKLGIKKS